MAKIKIIVEIDNQSYENQMTLSTKDALAILVELGFEAKPPYSGVSVERLVEDASSVRSQAETGGNAPIAAASSASGRNTKGEARGARQGEDHE